MNPSQFDWLDGGTHQLTLANNLNEFIGWAVGCYAYHGSNVAAGYFLPDITGVHLSMGLGKLDVDLFVNQTVQGFYSWGYVPGPSAFPERDDETYLRTVFHSFNRGGLFQVCSAASCDNATTIAEFNTGVAGVDNTFYGNWDGSSTVYITPGTYVHWNLDLGHNVQQIDSPTSGTPTTNGFTSGPVGGTPTYTHQFTTIGTFYFNCAVHTTMQGTVIVTATLPTRAANAAQGAASPSPLLALALALAATLLVKSKFIAACNH